MAPLREKNELRFMLHHWCLPDRRWISWMRAASEDMVGTRKEGSAIPETCNSACAAHSDVCKLSANSLVSFSTPWNIDKTYRFIQPSVCSNMCTFTGGFVDHFDRTSGEVQVVQDVRLPSFCSLEFQNAWYPSLDATIS